MTKTLGATRTYYVPEWAFKVAAFSVYGPDEHKKAPFLIENEEGFLCWASDVDEVAQVLKDELTRYARRIGSEIASR